MNLASEIMYRSPTPLERNFGFELIPQYTVEFVGECTCSGNKSPTEYSVVIADNRGRRFTITGLSTHGWLLDWAVVDDAVRATIQRLANTARQEPEHCGMKMLP